MSKGYKEWLKLCRPLILPDCGAIDFPVEVVYTLYLPDKRKRDLSNYIKATEDYLVDQAVLFDDNHTVVQEVGIILGGIDRGNPRVEIEIYPIDAPVSHD
jgi:Holliday junction resolvase RusA-like endonuclease